MSLRHRNLTLYITLLIFTGAWLSKLHSCHFGTLLLANPTSVLLVGLPYGRVFYEKTFPLADTYT